MRFNENVTYCDDGNLLNGDGWDSTWLLESGWRCTGGTPYSKDTWFDIWGDGKKYASNSSYWDDGNKIDGDGWRWNWTIEEGWTCTGGTPTSQDICTAICGDGLKLGAEAWDDGNINPGDGWSSGCTIETGWLWSGGSATTKDACTEIWGDGIRFNSNITYWDDGNKSDGDGCNSSCSIEKGWICSGGTTSTKDVWTEIWGDGIRFNTNATYCDDGNNFNGDGWDSSCLIETGWKWAGGSTSTADKCTEIWGDGIRFNTNSTYWDDGNLSNGDGCDFNCLKEIGWKWNGGNSSAKDKCSEIWGDGFRFNSNSAYCDDGNLLNGDGCNSTCKIELGWLWTGGKFNQKDIWSEIWGDGIRFNSNSSYWDDGNTDDYDGWSSSWKIEAEYKWSEGNVTSKDICIIIFDFFTPETKASQILLTLVLTGLVFNIIASVVGNTSPIGCYSMINHIQLMLLILSTGTYVTDGISNMIAGSTFVLLNFDFLKIENSGIFKPIYQSLAFEQVNNNLKSIGIVSGSTFMNLFKALLIFCFIAMIHLVMLVLNKLFQRSRNQSLLAKT